MGTRPTCATCKHFRQSLVEMKTTIGTSEVTRKVSTAGESVVRDENQKIVMDEEGNPKTMQFAVCQNKDVSKSQVQTGGMRSAMDLYLIKKQPSEEMVMVYEDDYCSNYQRRLNA